MIKSLTIRNNDNNKEYDVEYEIKTIGRPNPYKKRESLEYIIKEVPKTQLTARSGLDNDLSNDFVKKNSNNTSPRIDFRKLYKPEPDMSDSSMEARQKDYDWYDDEDLKKLMKMIDELIEPAEWDKDEMEAKQINPDKLKDENKSTNGTKDGTKKSHTDHLQGVLKERSNSIPTRGGDKEKFKELKINESINYLDKLTTENEIISRNLESGKSNVDLYKTKDSSNHTSKEREATRKMDELVSRNLPENNYESENINSKKKVKKNLNDKFKSDNDVLKGRSRPNVKTLPDNEKLLEDLLNLFEMQTHMNDSNGRSIYVFENSQKDDNEMYDLNEPDLSARDLPIVEDKKIVKSNCINNSVSKNSKLVDKNLPKLKVVEIDTTKMLGENKAFDKLKNILKGKKNFAKKHKRKGNTTKQETIAKENRQIIKKQSEWIKEVGEMTNKSIPNSVQIRSLEPNMPEQESQVVPLLIQPAALSNHNSTTYNSTLNLESRSAPETEKNETHPNQIKNTTDEIKSRSTLPNESLIHKNTTKTGYQENDKGREVNTNVLTSNKSDTDSTSIMPVTRSIESYFNLTDDYKNYDDEKLNKEVEEIMKLLADDEVAGNENNELMERSASEMGEHDLFPESYELAARSQIDPETYHQLRLNMMKQLLSMEGPKECRKTRNLNNVIYPDAKSISHQVSYYDTERNLKEIEEHETYLCIDPPKYPDYFFKLQTVIKVVPSSGVGPEVIKAIERKYYDNNGREFNWEPETQNSSSS